jgi:protease IV
MVKKRKWSVFDIFSSVGHWVSLFVRAVFFLFIIVIVVGMFAGPAPSGNVALIPVEGVITTDGAAQSYFSSYGASSTRIVEWIEEVGDDPQYQAVLFEINSPGGSPVASEEIANAIKKLNKTTVAVIRDAGASGGYWVASAADKIFASRMSITGSIGVVASDLEYSGLLNRYNVTYRRMVAGKYKDAGSPFRPFTSEERDLQQAVLDTIHGYFIEEVAQNRDLSVEKVRELATGFIFLGSEARELGLIDEIGSREDAISYIEEKLNITAEVAEFSSKPSLAELFGGIISQQSFAIGQGIGSFLVREGPKTVSVWT